jgi:DNA mismatch endonuclease, patch repair protein
MADVHSIAVRSYNMSQIKSKNTKPEILVRKFLFANGFRYRLHQNKLPGKPDLVFPKLKKVVFIHGCFWHGHKKCKFFIPPKTRTEWWLNKINGNKKRDYGNAIKLKSLGWSMITVWQCELTPDKRNATLLYVKNKLSSEQ